MAKLTSFVMTFLLMTAHPLAVQAIFGEIIGAAAGVAVATVAAPFVLGGLGFGAAGIAAGSFAAKAMSTVYAYQVGLGALATAQSVGAAGVGLAGATIGAAVGAGAGHYVSSHRDDD